MTAIDDLYAEDIPTRPEPVPPTPRAYRSSWTPQEQDAHWHDLCHAVGTPNAKRPNHPPDSSQTAA